MHKDTKEIERKKEMRIGWIAFLLLFFHFFLIVTFIFSSFYPDSTAKKVSSQYVVPFFEQKWNMFAPCPIISNRFKFRYIYENDTSDWIDPSIESLKKHSKYRASYHGNLAVGEYNLLYWVKLDFDSQNIPIDTILNFQKYPSLKTMRGMFLLKNYLKGYRISNHYKKPISTEIIFNYRNVKTTEVITYHLNQFR